MQAFKMLKTLCILIMSWNQWDISPDFSEYWVRPKGTGVCFMLTTSETIPIYHKNMTQQPCNETCSFSVERRSATNCWFPNTKFVVHLLVTSVWKLFSIPQLSRSLEESFVCSLWAGLWQNRPVFKDLASRAHHAINQLSTVQMLFCIH